MGFTAVKCPSCGSTIELDESREFGFCSYCGTKIVQDRIVVEHKGSISVSGFADEQSLLERASYLLEDGHFSNASLYYDRVLDMNPKCSKAYIGKLLCSLHMTHIIDLKNSNKCLEKYNSFLKAKRFATEAEVSKLEEIEKEVRERLESESEEKEKKLAEMEAQKSRFASELKQEKEYQIKNQKKKTMWLILLTVFSVTALSSFVFALINFYSAVFIHDGNRYIIIMILLLVLILLPSCFGIVYAIKSMKKANQEIDSFFDKCTEYDSFKEEVRNYRIKYKAWKTITF